MIKCPLLDGCCFFNDICENMPAPCEYLKDNYCKKDHSQCARYQVYQNTNGEGVPSDLFPHDMDRIEIIIKEYKYYQGD